jgi:hypothetical protein
MYSEASNITTVRNRWKSVNIIFILFILEDLSLPPLLLYLANSVLLSLPSFLPSNLTIAPYPVPDLVYSTSGVLTGGIIICGGKQISPLPSCFSLHGKTWVRQPSLATGRDSAAASLTMSGELMVSGGWDGSKLLSSTEVYHNSSWHSGPDLPIQLKGHCQVLVGDRPVIVGGATNYGPSTSVYYLRRDSWTHICLP